MRADGTAILRLKGLGKGVAADDLTEEQLVGLIRKRPLPAHVAVIMDGNGRWARARNLPRIEGHRAGVEALRDVVRASGELGLKYLTVYAFSTENWKRPRWEIDGLMHLLVEYLTRYLGELNESNVRVRTIGHPEELPGYAWEELQAAIEKTRHNDGLQLVLALNYGARREVVDAVRRIIEDVGNSRLDASTIDEGLFAKYLDTADMPDPDLVIRASGEMRLSNFLLWQVAYAEFWTTPVCWPDFRRTHLYQAILDFQLRERRFGGLR